MAERRNSAVCTFDPASQKVTAYDIHEWIHDILRIPEKTVKMLEIEGPKRQGHIQLADTQCVLVVIRVLCEQVEYRDINGETSIVTIAMTEMGIKKIRIENLPPQSSINPWGTLLPNLAKS